MEIPVSEYVPAGADVRLTMDAARTRFVERKVQENSRQLTVAASVFNEGPGETADSDPDCAGWNQRHLSE